MMELKIELGKEFVNNLLFVEAESNDADKVYQAMAEEENTISDDDRLIEFEDLEDDDVKTLLNDAKKKGFIEDFEINEA